MSRFSQDLKVGQYAECVLDDVLTAIGFRLRNVSQSLQEKGIDRLALHESGESVRVEYKCDFQAHYTGNIFLEHIKNVGKNSPGWAQTCESEYLFYYLPQRGHVYVFFMPDFKLAYPTLIKSLEERTVRCNELYEATGYLLPIDKIADVPGYMNRLEAPEFTRASLLAHFEDEVLH